MKSREQTLVDVCFACAAMVSDPKLLDMFQKMGLEGRMEWVAKQLKEMGFPTHPVGLSWGILDQPS